MKTKLKLKLFTDKEIMRNKNWKMQKENLKLKVKTEKWKCESKLLNYPILKNKNWKM